MRSGLYAKGLCCGFYSFHSLVGRLGLVIISLHLLCLFGFGSDLWLRLLLWLLSCFMLLVAVAVVAALRARSLVATRLGLPRLPPNT